MDAKKVLIVDDEEMVRESIMFSLLGYCEDLDIITAANGQEGLDLYRQEKPDLIILDLRMPVMDGLEFLNQINISPADSTAIIVLTGHGGDEEIKQSFNMGISSFLNKPFNVYELRGLVRHTLALKETQKELQREIEERRAAEKARDDSEKKFQAISTSAQDAVIMLDEKGNISFWNQSAFRIFGYSAQEIMGKSMQEMLMPAKYHHSFTEGFSYFQDTGQGPLIGQTVEMTAKRKNGEEIITEISISAVSLDGKWNAVGILRDVSNRRQVEDELCQYRNEMKNLLDDVN